MVIAPGPHFNLGRRGSQHVLLTLDGERVVSDPGLLAVRGQAILTQEVYQIRAGYPDFADANTLRDVPEEPDAVNNPAPSSPLCELMYTYRGGLAFTFVFVSFTACGDLRRE
jgi:hypothetical protein